MSYAHHCPSVLLVEESEKDFYLLSKMFLELSGSFEMERVRSLDEARAFLEKKSTDVLLLSLKMPPIDRQSPLEDFFHEHADLPVVLLSELQDELRFKRLIKLGAQEALLKRGLCSSLVKSAIHHAFERKLTESHLREISTMKSNFVAMVSHEIRSPLTSIKVSLDAVLNEEVGPLNEEQKRYLYLTRRGVDRLHLLLNDLLDLSKIEAGKIELHKEEVDLTLLAEEAVAMFYKQYQDKGLSLTIYHPVKHIILEADRNRIMQIWINLLANAFKFTGKGGVSITLEDSDVHVKCTVADSGNGIHPEDIPHVFQDYTQFGKQTAGTGLGLKISREFVLLHGGEMWVESEYQKGTRFIFTLPRIT